MKTEMKALLFLLPWFALPVSARASGVDLKITAKMLTFNRQLDEGESFSCTHVVENEAAQDWRVVCGAKRYTVHLWVTAYPHASGAAKVSYEVLYWLTDWTDTSHPIGNGTTFWFHLKEKSALAGLDVRLSVDNDNAGLYLNLNPSTW